jgi:hypothetical protein
VLKNSLLAIIDAHNERQLAKDELSRWQQALAIHRGNTQEPGEAPLMVPWQLGHPWTRPAQVDVEDVQGDSNESILTRVENLIANNGPLDSFEELEDRL